jgi:serralysin
LNGTATLSLKVPGRVLTSMIALDSWSEIHVMTTYPGFLRAVRNESAETIDWRYYQNTADGEPVTITYNFMTGPMGPAWYGDPDYRFKAYSALDKALVETALHAFGAISGVTFVRDSSQNADLMFGRFDISGSVLGYADMPWVNKTGPVTQSSQLIMIDVDQPLTTASWGYQVVLHEIGHALGLKHTFEGQSRLLPAEDNIDNSVMSYTEGATSYGLGPYDIMALQSIYGPAKARLGSSTYKFGASKIIWDGGGIDTITASHLHEKVTLYLDDGTQSYFGRKHAILASKQVWLGHFTMIENAVGGTGNDAIYGNELANDLKGGSGNDRLSGRTGDDRLHGGSGNDHLYGGAGADTLYGGPGKDRFIFKTLNELGSLSSFDRIQQFDRNDVLDFRSFDADPAAPGRQKIMFTGNFSADVEHQAAGTAYYNRVTDTLMIETTGDGVADCQLAIKGVDVLKSAYFVV